MLIRSLPMAGLVLIHFELDPDFLALGFASGLPWNYTQGWNSVDVSGRWLYAMWSGSDRTSSLFYGYIEDDGSVQWHGILYQSIINRARCFVQAGALWIADEANLTLRRIVVSFYGSLPGRIRVNRGAASTT